MIIPLSLEGHPYRISYYGRVHPSGINISIDDNTTADFREDSFEYSLRIFPIVKNSKIIVHCYVSRLVDDYLSKIAVSVYNVLRARIGLVSFSLGVGTLISIDKVTDVSGITTTTNFGVIGLSALCTSFTGTINYGELHLMATLDQSLGLALDDLILATALPNHTAVNCARAVDGIRNLIAGNDTKESLAWEAMRSSLNADKKYVQDISDLSKEHRHAKRILIPTDKLNIALTRSWILMDRYFHLRLRNIDRLPLNEFPMLLG